jgi:hypothetical protein
MLDTKVLLFLLLAFFCEMSVAQNHCYLDDVNDTANPPTYDGNFPKIQASQTQSSNATAEQWSKYDVIGTG